MQLSQHGLRASAAVLVLLVGACVTESRVRLHPDSGPVAVTRTEPLRAWSLLDEGRAVGIVILFADPDTPQEPTRRYFSVRNMLHQELGSIDALGRAWRFVPHQREARLLGASTLVEGAGKILDAGSDARLVELPISGLKSGDAGPERAEEPARPRVGNGARPRRR